jgi:molybdenum cofactor cytidylyltransferase
MLSVQSAAALVDLPSNAIICHDVRNPAERSEVLARKGTSISLDEVAALLDRGVSELHLALPDEGDVGENEAANRLAAALGGTRVTADKARYGQTNLVSLERGMLRVNTARLDRVNAHDGVLLLTAEGDRGVDAGTTLGVVKCARVFVC